MGVFSEGIHSALDLISATVAFFTVREAGKPADSEHPFGHGKIETLSSLFESLLLIAAAVLIFSEAFRHLRHPEPLQHPDLAVAMIAVSLVASYFMYRHNLKAAQNTESSALHVNALHFLADVVASAGVLAGLILLRLTGWLLIDPLIAFGIAIYILLISAQQVKNALLELTDTRLPESEVDAIQAIFKEFQQRAIDFHDLRTRKSGATRHIDFHLTLCGKLTVHASHAFCDEIESRILERFPSASVNIHVEPCEPEVKRCHHPCHAAPSP